MRLNDSSYIHMHESTKTDAYFANIYIYIKVYFSAMSTNLYYCIHIYVPLYHQNAFYCLIAYHI